MPRQRCCGLIDDLPLCQTFSPNQQSGGVAVILQFEELEAIRLKDTKALEQIACAQAMGLSRPTFQRILQSARNKIATALVEGRTIVIEGGNFLMKNRVFECIQCKHVWEVEPCVAGGKHGYQIACPQCGSFEKAKIESDVKHTCGGGQHTGQSGGCCGGH